MKDIGPICEVIYNDQDGVALLVGVILVVLGNGEGRVNDLLYLLTAPVVEDVLLFLLVELVAHIFLQGTPGAIVVNRRTEHVYS
ncbi:hypothetical protein N9L68_07850 [bacterium]|nr:hypothetical protein [bacterium]